MDLLFVLLNKKLKDLSKTVPKSYIWKIFEKKILKIEKP